MMMNRGKVSVRRVLLIVSALVLVGCGSGGGEPAATPTPSESPRVYTLDELQAALPGVDDVPTGSMQTISCPGEDWCVDNNVSVGIDMNPPIDPVDAERVGHETDVNDSAYVDAWTFANVTAAADKVDEDRSDAQPFTGDFDVKPETAKIGFVPGERGSGTIEDVSVAGWDGFSASRTSRWVSPDDSVTFENDDDIETTVLTVVRGSSVLSVRVTVKAEYREAGAAEVIARQVAEEYIARLG